MQLQKAWARFFTYTLLIIGLLSLVMLAMFYNSEVRQDVNRTQIIDDFVQTQRLDLIKNVVNNLVAEVNVQKLAAEKEAAGHIAQITAILDYIYPAQYADDERVAELIGMLAGLHGDADVLAYNTRTGSVTGSKKSGLSRELNAVKDRRTFENLFADYTASNVYKLSDVYLIGYGIDKDATYNAVLSSMHAYADSQVPLGDVEIRIDALKSYDFEGDFATRIVTPFFQRNDIVAVNRENIDYSDILEQIVTNGEAYTIYMEGGTFERIVYARLYRPYDWVVSSSVSALDIQQLTGTLAEQFEQQQQRYITIFSVLGIMFTASALIVFIVLGRIFFRRADTEFKVMDERSNIDKLTGIFNRHYMEENLKKTIAFLSRTEGRLGLLIIDVDCYKLYNDTYGHGRGDECLKIIAQTLKDSLPREADFVARYGGEEFVVVLPGTDEDGIHSTADKLLENVRSLKMPHEKNTAAPYVTISIGGTSAMVLHTHDWKDYVKVADEALYKSKNDGRDRYTYLGFE